MQFTAPHRKPDQIKVLQTRGHRNFIEAKETTIKIASLGSTLCSGWTRDTHMVEKGGHLQCSSVHSHGAVQIVERDAASVIDRRTRVK